MRTGRIKGRNKKNCSYPKPSHVKNWNCFFFSLDILHYWVSDALLGTFLVLANEKDKQYLLHKVLLPSI